MIIQGMILTGIDVYDSSFNSKDALLYVDAAQPSSYLGSGTTWTDLSVNTNNGTTVNSPAYTYGGYFTFNGSTQYVTTVAAEYNQTYTGKTVIIMARMNASFGTGYRCMFGTSAGSRNFSTYMYSPSVGTYQIHFSTGLSGSFQGGISDNISVTTNQWFVVAVTHTTEGVVTYYVNGQQVGAAQTGVTFRQYLSSGTENIGAGDNYFYGDISMCAVYGRALNPSEILQNYNSLKDRFSYTTSNLKLYYNPTDTSSYPRSGTTVTDLSTSGLSGTMSNITFANPYFTYNGTSSTMSVADNALIEPGSGDFTLEIWIYYSVITGASRCVVSKTDGGNSADWGYGIRTASNGNTYMEVGNGSATVTTPTFTASTGQWYHVVGVWTNVASNSIALYVNGVSQGSNSHSFTSVKNTTRPLSIGSFDGGATYGQWVNGRIGIVRYYNSALTSDEITTNYLGSKAIYGL